MQWYDYWLWFTLVLSAIGSVGTIVSVGKRRAPMTGGVAAFVVLVNIITIIALYLKLTV